MFQEASHPVSHQLFPENGWFQEKNVDGISAPGISEPLQTLVLIGLKKRKVIPLTLRAAWGRGGVHPPLNNFFL